MVFNGHRILAYKKAPRRILKYQQIIHLILGREEKKMKKRLISIVMTVLMILTFTPYTFAADVSQSGATVTGGDTITADGTYQVAAILYRYANYRKIDTLGTDD